MAHKRFTDEQHIYDLNRAQEILKAKLASAKNKGIYPIPSIAPIFTLDEMQESHDGQRRHRLRKVLFTSIVISAIIAFFRSSLPAKVMQAVFSHDTDDETETITLPIDSHELKDLGNEVHLADNTTRSVKR